MGFTGGRPASGPDRAARTGPGAQSGPRRSGKPPPSGGQGKEKAAPPAALHGHAEVEVAASGTEGLKGRGEEQRISRLDEVFFGVVRPGGEPGKDGGSGPASAQGGYLLYHMLLQRGPRRGRGVRQCATFPEKKKTVPGAMRSAQSLVLI